MNTPVTRAPSKEPAPLRVGFVALNDCAPLVVARELGFFEKYGLKVELRRELGWATVRDKIIHGELDAAHALAGMPVAAAFGLGSIKCECVAGLILSLHGNAITLSTELREKGVCDALALRELMRKERRTFTFGVVCSFSSHNFLLRQWLASGGIDPKTEVRIVVVPPAQMVANLRSGNLDGYCVGEPWNSVAVNRGIGWCPAASAELSPGHPEKVLMTRRKFAEERRNEQLPLIASLIEACAFCDRAENVDEVARVLALPRYLNLPLDILALSLRGGLKSADTPARDFHIFHRNGANEPSQEKIAWITRSVLQSGLLPDRATFPISAAQQIFSSEIFSEAHKRVLDPKIRETQLTYA